MPSRRLLADETATRTAGGKLARLVKPPLFVALKGELGAGKTTFAGGFAAGLGHKGAVASPTFAMVNEYRKLTPRVVHMDLYRAGPLDLPGLALEEYFEDAGAVCLVEWPENAGDLLPKDRLEVTLHHAKEGRTLAWHGTGARSKALAAKWRP
ncbi:tRNA (adenosine(37)-N6)-threonylcarbamoyltransferase complex ATPase subunit type 1 TsaE [bacterium]|nr:MAG: tRNA (adenosine(37)-N6)-threonylcarbamoyltransferase complex ATPase subunit type 1 TsaE [bacterium]